MVNLRSILFVGSLYYFAENIYLNYRTVNSTCLHPVIGLSMDASYFACSKSPRTPKTIFQRKYGLKPEVSSLLGSLLKPWVNLRPSSH